MSTAGHPHTLEIEGNLDLLAIYRADPERWPYLLTSTSPGGQLGRFSLLLFQHGETHAINNPGAGQQLVPEEQFFETLKQLPIEPVSQSNSPWPFVGGWFIYLSYEVVASIEPRLKLPTANDQLPVAWLARCPAALILDNQTRITHLIAEDESSLALARIHLEQSLATLKSPEFEPANEIPDIELVADPGDRFKAGVERIREWIRAGDVFQVNLSRAWRGKAVGDIDAAAVYAALAVANPSPFAGMARMPGGTVISSSPERLVEVRNGIAQTRPIAGTRPRGHDVLSDASLSAELMANPKERAEHIMLIDLERNDLGRVCEAGSVEVDELMVVESYAHVHHIVSNVRGRLKPDVDLAQVIQAVFPGGTITGCPKVRCMEIIAELEGQGRSFYTGSMGYIGRDGHMDLNILIRSLRVTGSELEFRTGAGIVADSQPEAELDETHAKARGLLRALGVQ